MNYQVSHLANPVTLRAILDTLSYTVLVFSCFAIVIVLPNIHREAEAVPESVHALKSYPYSIQHGFDFPVR